MNSSQAAGSSAGNWPKQAVWYPVAPMSVPSVGTSRFMEGAYGDGMFAVVLRMLAGSPQLPLLFAFYLDHGA